MRGLLAFVVLTSTLLLSVGEAVAGIVTTTGQVTVVAAPGSVQQDVLESDTTLFLFSERAGVTLAAPLLVNINTPGTYNDFSQTLFPLGSIPAGTAVDSYFLHGDTTLFTNRYIGSITFDTPILGVAAVGIFSGIGVLNTLDPSDPVLGAPGTSYPTGLDGRGMEFFTGSNASDVITLSADMKTLSFDIQAAGVMDQLRIVTAAAPPQTAVPEPSSLVLAGLGVAGAAGAAWRRKRRPTAGRGEFGSLCSPCKGDLL